MGYFTMGSTVIILVGKDQIKWLPNLTAGSIVKMGEEIGQTLA